MVVDTATHTVTATITPPMGSLLDGIAISPDGRRAYVTAGHLDVVHIIDTSSNTVAGTITGIGSSPKAVAVSPDGRRLFVTNNQTSGSVTVIDTVTATAVATIPVGEYPSAVAFTPDGTKAYVANQGIDDGVFTVAIIDTASYSVVGPPIVVGSFPGSVAITEDGTRAYVGNEASNTVSVIDTDSNTVITTITAMSSPRGVTARPIPPGIQVPDVVGQFEAAATQIITAAGLTLGTVTRQSSSTVASGRVISQDPARSSYVARDSAVNLVVSTGGRGRGRGGGAVDPLMLLGLFAMATLAQRSPRRP
jgi:YVTN family beta-propeller protein